MNGPGDDWSELQHAWQSRSDPDALELDRVRARIARAERLATLRTALDVAACAVGGAVGLWALLRGTGTGLVVGLAALAFTAFGGWIAWRSARARRPPVGGTVAEALDAAIALERGAEDWARAVTPMAAGAAAFLGVLALATAWNRDTDVAGLRSLLEAVGVALLVVAVATGVGHGLARRAERRRSVLERRRRELEA
jgi:hypothetical protein